MKYIKYSFTLFFIALTLSVASTGFTAKSRGGDPWRADQLIRPDVMAAVLNAGIGKMPVILNIGIMSNIKGAVAVGAADTPDGLKKLQEKLKTLSKSQPIIIYCGCCPLYKCPNVRPAFKLLQSEGFTHIQVLDIEHNLRIDWIGKGYPVEKD